MKLQADVLVAGGGSAGLAASMAAAASGKKVVLVERDQCLGGMGTTALVHTFCGLYLPVVEGEEPRLANVGVPAALVRRLTRAGGAGAPRRMGRVWVLPHDPATLARVLEEWVEAMPALRWLRGAELEAAETTEEGLAGVVARQGKERIEVEAKAFVDATGDAALTALGGAAWESAEPGRLLRPACVVELKGVDAGCLTDDGRLQLAHATMRAVQAGELPQTALGCGLRAGVHAGQAFLTLDLEGPGGDGMAWRPLDAACVAEVRRLGREVVTQVLALWRRQHEGMRQTEVARWPARLGVRESRRAIGAHVLTGEEVLASSRFEDAAAVAAWPLELRENARGPRLLYPESGEPAEIPLRSLRHREVRNLWLAGRCLSADHEAAASIRVMGTCLATGQAAGLAAVLTSVEGRLAGDWNGVAREIRSRVAALSEL